MNKLGKANAAVIILVVVIAALFVLLFPTGTQNKDFMEIKLYNAEGVEILNTESFAVVNNVPGVAFVSVTINALNTGNTDLSLSLLSLTPSPFNAGVTDRAVKTAAPGQSASWSSGLIDVNQLGTGSIPFTVSVRGNYIVAGQTRTKDATGTLTLNIQPDAAGDFTVTITQGSGDSGPVCGNSVCETGETTTSCASDCTVSTLKVMFRTTDVTYASGSAIAVANTCGAPLIAYGYSGTSSLACPGSLSMTVIGTGVNGVQYCTRTGETTRIYISSGTSTKFYETTDPDATKVSTSLSSVNSGLEVSC